MFTVAGAVIGIVSAFAQNTPNNPASWIALGLIAYQIVLNSFQFLARTSYKGTVAGAKLADVAEIMGEVRGIALDVLSHQAEIKANVAEVKTVVDDTAATLPALTSAVATTLPATAPAGLIVPGVAMSTHLPAPGTTVTSVTTTAITTSPVVVTQNPPALIIPAPTIETLPSPPPALTIEPERIILPAVPLPETMAATEAETAIVPTETTEETKQTNGNI